ncbi:MAG: type 1 glutamine amidotransferase domain-containing protein [Armatimonadota bacterium]|nr:type 1 glutamine amidotransferase [bacterium]
MYGNKLENIRVAAIMTDGFEQVEFTSPRDALVSEGAVVHIVSPSQRLVRGMHHNRPGDQFEIDVPIDQANPEDYDAVLLPGGVANADKLRENESVQNFLRHINEQNKLIAVICHGPWTLISAGLVSGRRMTSYHTIKDDLINAGARWVDEAVVEDENFLSSRHPGDLPEFDKHLVDKLAQTQHAHAYRAGVEW